MEPEAPGDLEFAEEQESVDFVDLPGLGSDVDPAQEGRQVGRLFRRQASQ
jgi:hypothetical protein